MSDISCISKEFVAVFVFRYATHSQLPHNLPFKRSWSVWTKCSYFVSRINCISFCQSRSCNRCSLFKTVSWRMYLMQKQNAYVAHLIVTVVQYANGYCTLYLMVYVTAALIW